jgi:hypothetical protein
VCVCVRTFAWSLCLCLLFTHARTFPLKGPLPADLLWEIDRVHMRNRLPIFCSDTVGANAKGRGEIGEPIP